MNLTRRNFIKAVTFTSLATSFNLVGCSSENDEFTGGGISYDMLLPQYRQAEDDCLQTEFKFLVYSSKIDEKETNLGTPKNHIMLVYTEEKYESQTILAKNSENCSACIKKWTKDKRQLPITQIYTGPIDEDYRASTDNLKKSAREDLERNFNILEEYDAFDVLIGEYGVKEEYTNEEIQSVLERYEKLLKSKTYKKTAI